MSGGIALDRAELLRLRARIVVLERAALAALGLVLRLRAEELDVFLETTRAELSDAYADPAFSPDLPDPVERGFVAGEVEHLMRALQHEMGFPQGIAAPERG